MNRFRSFRLACLVVFVGVGLVPGCGGKLPSMTPVSGKVTINGQSLTGGQVSLIPDIPHPNEEGAKPSETQTAGLSAGQIGSDGTYKIFTAGKEGAPLGKYKVTVTPSMIPSGDAKTAPASGFNPKYSDARNTPLRIEVVANSEPSKYDLKLTK
jgi:hypothetical protein